jgi:anti-sigma B factor antagonist
MAGFDGESRLTSAIPFGKFPPVSLACSSSETERTRTVEGTRFRLASFKEWRRVGTSDNVNGEHSASPESFEVRIDGDDDALRVLVSGELVLSTVEELQEAIRKAEQSRAGAIVVDLSGLRFLDSTGLSALLGAYSRSRDAGHRISFVPSDHEAVRKLIALTGTSEMFD